MQHALPNTILFAIIVGIGGYVLSFLMAWSLAQVTKGIRTVLAVMLYSPSLTGAAMMGAVWTVLFSADKTGYLNALLLEWGVIQTPISFLTGEKTLMLIMMLVSLWSSMGIGFLAMIIMPANQPHALAALERFKMLLVMIKA